MSKYSKYMASALMEASGDDIVRHQAAALIGIRNELRRLGYIILLSTIVIAYTISQVL